MMATTLEILTWDRDRLAISGKLATPEKLLMELHRACYGVKREYLRGDGFTFSFPRNQRREVVRIVENLE